MILHLIAITLIQFFIPAFSIPLQSQWEDTNSLGMSDTFQGDDDDAPDFLLPDTSIFPQMPGMPLNQEEGKNSTHSENSMDNAMNKSNNGSATSDTNMTQQQPQDENGNHDTSTQSGVEGDDTELVESLIAIVNYDYFASDSRSTVQEEKQYLENGVETYYHYNKTVSTTNNSNNNNK